MKTSRMKKQNAFCLDRWNFALLLFLALPLFGFAQVSIDVQAVQDLPPAPAPQTAPKKNTSNPPTSLPPQPNPGSPMSLTLKQAEALAIKNNPQISMARLNALASHQAMREVRSNLWPQMYADLTAVDARNNSRISAGALNNPIIYTRAASGATVSQLITDFGHTTNLVASADLQAKAENQNAAATKEQVLLAVDGAFYNALQTRAVLRVAEETEASRQLVSDQVSALTKSKLRSALDLSFANVNLAQAKLLYLDALNNGRAAMASLSAILGYASLQNFDLVADTEPLAPPPADVDQLIAEAFSVRPEILAVEFEWEASQKLHLADRDQLFPTISALAAFGDAPIRDDRITSAYRTAGVNVQVPVFNGFLYTAKSHESDLRAQALRERMMDLRNQISRDVRTSWLAANTGYDRVSVSEQLLAQANLALDLAQTRYKLGLSSIVELSQAQLQQTQAEIANAQAGYEYRLALSVLRYQTSGL
jgi:outer membrane protein